MLSKIVRLNFFSLKFEVFVDFQIDQRSLDARIEAEIMFLSVLPVEELHRHASVCKLWKWVSDNKYVNSVEFQNYRERMVVKTVDTLHNQHLAPEDRTCNTLKGVACCTLGLVACPILLGVHFYCHICHAEKV